ncbi:zf-HC2 domain-containing protein [Pinirhizobacter sp.]|uniref:zf-HC2 domain-containing protein n=1 Tax=Pinirhizobacter sp. TaxID=2950432 RepID=UPI002F3FA233
MTFTMDTNRDCARAWEAMPSVLQESASPEQNVWLMDHLAHCESCSADYAQQERLRLALSLPADIPVDPAVGLKRLLARLDVPLPKPVVQRARNGWLTRALAAAVLLQALAIGALGAKYWSDNTNPAYRTLSQTSAPVPTGALHVVPDASMSLADWNALLHSLNLQVVGGPNDVGAYTVVPSGSSTAGSPVLQKLRATRGIRLAEPVASAP